MDVDTHGTWPEWSKHVLKELQRLNAGQDSIRAEIHELKSGIVKLGVVETKLEEIGVWKDNMTEVVSPTQLKALVVKVEALESFKIKSVAIFTFVQVCVAALVGALNLL
jgi:hypothetical protein